MKATLYGTVTNWSSRSQVTEGFRLGLGDRLHKLVAVDLPQEEEDRGEDAEWGILTGPPSWLGSIPLQHRERTVMIAPNSSRIPRDLAERLEQMCTRILVPSQWAAQVIRKLVRLPVMVVPHGVHPKMQVHREIREYARAVSREHLMLLHFSTTDRGRKGTLELLQAWEQVYPRLPSKSRLNLILDEHAKLRVAHDCAEHQISTSGINVYPRLVGGMERMGSDPWHVGMALARASAVIQPSRGEGFGLVPLEARACGVPVVATACTGHSEHLEGCGVEDGVVIVPHGPEAEIDDGVGAMAPTVEPSAIVEAILRLVDTYPSLHQAALEKASAVAERWSWTRCLMPLYQDTGGMNGSGSQEDG